MSKERALQRKILEHLSEYYPSASREVGGLGEPHETLRSLYYLRELGLVDLTASDFIDGSKKVHNGKITAKGIDFLADDGGVSAILSTVTVRLHEDTLRQLIEAKVQASNLPEEQKSGILKALREAPGETTRLLITKLVDLGMDNAPKAIPLIQTWLLGSPS